MKLAGVAAVREETVGVVVLREGNQANGDALLAKSSREVLRRLLTAAVAVGVEGDIDRPRGIRKLTNLTRVEKLIRTQRQFLLDLTVARGGWAAGRVRL